MQKKFIRNVLTKVLLIVLLGLSFIGFLIVKHLSDKNIRMPGHFVVERINGVTEKGTRHADTVFHRLRDFDLVNQLGNHITRKDLEGKVTLVTFFHTTDTLVAPQLSSILQKIQDTFAPSDSGLHILSITTDPEYDSVPALKAYADRYRTNHDIWWFLHGTREQVLDMAKTDFEVDLQRKDSTTDYDSPRIILLDKREYVRGYYNVTDSTQVRACVRDISMLMLESKKATQ